MSKENKDKKDILMDAFEHTGKAKGGQELLSKDIPHPHCEPYRKSKHKNLNIDKDGYIVRHKLGTTRAERRATNKMFNKKFSDSTSWRKLNAIYKSCRELGIATATTAMMTKPYVKFMTKMESETLAFLIKIANNDLVRFNKELEMIHDVHRDRRGKSSLDDIDLLMDIVEKYSIYAQQYEAIVSPVTDHIVDLIHIAEERIMGISMLTEEEAMNFESKGVLKDAMKIRIEALRARKLIEQTKANKSK